MAKTIEFEISSVNELDSVIDFLYPFLKPQTIFLFNGEMASGKTTVISNLLKRINIFEVSSPTYAIHQTYKSKNCDIHHFDLHRLKSATDIESVGFWDFFEIRNNIFFVEWAQHVTDDQWPMDYKIVKIKIDKKSELSRIFEIVY